MPSKGNLKKRRWKANKLTAAQSKPAVVPLRCPYCGSLAKLWPTTERLYSSGRDFGVAWVCSSWPACLSWVGCHPGTDHPLGRLANKELRQLKSRTHEVFDPLWRAKMRQVVNKGHARALAYKWLAGQLGIEPKDCHVGMFDEETCRRAIAICGPFAAKLDRLTVLQPPEADPRAPGGG